ncbi:MAG: ABC transporter substrate-binding protein [Cytophaga sp.]|nr:ABC transporter substrate-binding protein [Undibacterium sp.]
MIAGKRIGYINASSAHYTLLQGLASAGIAESQVKLILLDISDMPDALARGGIDEFSAWETTPTILHDENDQNHIVFRDVSTDYFIIEQNFVKISPHTALQLLAAFVRVIDWMRRSRHNTEKAFVWTRKDAALVFEKLNQL